MPKKKEYHFETLEQIVNAVNKENVEAIALDFASWIFYVQDVFDKIREKHPEYKDKLNSEIAKVSFVWIDDGQNKLRHVELKNKATGEKTIIKRKAR